MHNIFDLGPLRFSKMVGETDVYLFAGITGDFAANHVDGGHEAHRVRPQDRARRTDG